MEKHKSTAHIPVPKRKEPGNIVGIRSSEETPQGVVSKDPQAGKGMPRDTDSATDSLSLKGPKLEDTKKRSNEKSLTFSLHNLFRLILGQDNRAYAVFYDEGNAYALAVGSRKLDLKIRQYIQSQGERLKKSELAQINDDLQAEAELTGEITEVFHRVAPVTGGIEIDIGDELHTRVRITAGKVEVLKNEG